MLAAGTSQGRVNKALNERGAGMTNDGERLARIETKLETVIDNQATSLQRQQANASEIQALRHEHKTLNDKVDEALKSEDDLDTRLTAVEKWKAFWQTIFYGAKVVGVAMLATFTFSLTAGEKVLKLLGVLK
jgi:predicted RNase H-like nuclease (RuvC/YqgF family)